MGIDNSELIASFVEEANEGLADIEQDLLAIEEAGANVDQELVNKVFRCIHSIKGTSGFLGLTRIGELAHKMEDILNLIRNGELIPNSKIIDALLKSADVLREMVNNVAESEQVDISECIQELEQSLENDDGSGNESSNNDLPEGEVDIELPNGDIAFLMVPERELVIRQRRGNYIYVIEVDLIKDVEEKGCIPTEFLNKLYEVGELIDSYVSTAGLSNIEAEIPNTLLLRLLVASTLQREALAKELGISDDKVYLIREPQKVEPDQSSGQRDLPETDKSSKDNTTPDKKTSQSTGAEPSRNLPLGKDKSAKSIESADRTIRVKLSLLDRLMALTGELVLGRNQLLQIVRTKNFESLEPITVKLDQVTSELQEAIMQTRLQPIANVFNKFPRLVRDISSKLNKKCELMVEGKEVELDKTIIETIGDPLTHMVRNAIDHGIEPPDVRAAKGKPPTGTILLSAFHEGEKVNIRIKDDGGGIDVEKLKKKAIEKGVITPEQAMNLSDKEVVNFIFYPGFSTSENVTDVSGRGVGMDVVKTNIEKLGGTIEIETEKDKGTTFDIKLPLTLAIIPALIIQIRDDKYAIPQVNVNELVRVKSEEVSKRIQRVKGAEVLTLRGMLLPLVRLGEVLETPLEQVDSFDGPINVVVVDAGPLRYGLVVDSLPDSEEVVVKPLGQHFKDNGLFTGATILGDGTIALILDVAGIAAKKGINVSNINQLERTANGDRGYTEDVIRVLLFTNAPGEQFGVPMGLISRIEKIKKEQIDFVGGKPILQYRGKSLSVLRLEECLSANPAPMKDKMFVIVFKVAGVELGLLTPDLIDICDIKPEFDNQQLKEHGVIGSLIVNGKVTRIIDLQELVQKTTTTTTSTMSTSQTSFISPLEGKTGNDSRASATANVSAGSKPKILIAEDSNFFRKHLVEYLESSGYEVVGCEDGKIALDILENSEDGEFDLIITDIEMPNVDGYEFTRKVKSNPRFAHIPVIAVTSLASDDDITKGKEAGIDEYHIKLDKGALLETVNRFVGRGSAVN